jgi:hypothetical protein
MLAARSNWSNTNNAANYLYQCPHPSLILVFFPVVHRTRNPRPSLPHGLDGLRNFLIRPLEAGIQEWSLIKAIAFAMVSRASFTCLSGVAYSSTP